MILTWLCYAVSFLLVLSVLSVLGVMARALTEIAAILTEIRDELRKTRERRGV